MDPSNSEKKIIFDTKDLAPDRVELFRKPLPKWSPSGDNLRFSLILENLKESRLYLYDSNADLVKLLASEEDFFFPIFSYWSKDEKYIFYGGNFVWNESGQNLYADLTPEN